MAPAQQNVDMRDEVETQIKMTLMQNYVNDFKGAELCENNNTVIQDDASEKTTGDKDFDISKYEAMEFRPRIKWPDFTVQLSLHLVSLYGLYLVVTNSIRFYTTLFGKC